jgi:LAGLIDADG endonuclease
MPTGSYRWNPDCHSRTVESGQYRGKATQMRASDASYLAGFLDGDGSIHFQLVRQKEYRYGYYIRSSLSLSQSTTARSGLERLQRLIGGGYLRDRGTGMSDLVVTSRPLLIELLRAVEPYVIFKQAHVRRALWLLPQLGPRLNAQDLLRLAHEVDAFAALNYSKTKRISAVDVERHLRSMGMLAPVTTSPITLGRGDGFSATRQIYETHNTPAPRNGVKV